MSDLGKDLAQLIDLVTDNGPMSNPFAAIGGIQGLIGRLPTLPPRIQARTVNLLVPVLLEEGADPGLIERLKARSRDLLREDAPTRATEGFDPVLLAELQGQSDRLVGHPYFEDRVGEFRALLANHLTELRPALDRRAMIAQRIQRLSRQRTDWENITLLEPLGGGGYGVVYKAFDRSLGLTVAVKVGRLDKASPAMLTRVYAREWEMMSRVQSDLAVKAYKRGVTPEGEPYIVMELLAGGDLAEYLQYRKASDRQRMESMARQPRTDEPTDSIPEPLARQLRKAVNALGRRQMIDPQLKRKVTHLYRPPRRSRKSILDEQKFYEIAHQLTKPVAVLHERGLVHRDLKLANFLFTADGRIKLCDLAMAGPVETSHQRVQGTPGYMALESFTGVAHPRGDVFALGVIFYKLLTGLDPFPGNRVPKLNEDWPLSTRERRPERKIPPAFDHVVMKALSRAPGDRHEDAGEMMKAWERAAKTVFRRVRRGRRPFHPQLTFEHLRSWRRASLFGMDSFA